MNMDRDCQNVFAALSELIDRELPDADCQELEAHIQDCAPCVEFLESLKKSIALGRGYQPDVAVAELTPAIKESLREAYAKAIASRE